MVTVEEPERRIEYWDVAASQWAEIAESGPKSDADLVPGAYFNLQIADIENTTPSNPNPPHPPCDRRVFWMDMPNTYAIVKADGFLVHRQVVRQQLIIKDANSGAVKGTIMQRFELGFSPTGAHAPYYTFTGLGSTL